MTTFEAVVLAIVEGLTEFLPISSTGHLILTNALLNIEPSNFTKVYIINIQFGAILSVLVLYWRRFLQSVNFYYKLLVAFLPAAVFGLLLNDYIDALLESEMTVAISMVVGGVILVASDFLFKKQLDAAATDKDTMRVNTINEFGVEVHKEVLKPFPINYKQSLIVGIFQTISMIPGISRSAATTLGGLQQGLNMKRAAEFSFFLAVPTISAAAGYKLLKGFQFIKGTDMGFLIMGNLIAFVVAIFAIRFFITLITKYGLKFFGWYRIIVGLIIIFLLLTGHSLQMVD
jgi:undecaprenyl-diphosphatase